MLCPSNRMSPVGRLVDAGDEVEQRRLAGAVRADHADDLALVDVEVEAVDDPAGRRTPSTRRCSSSSCSAIRRSPRASRRAGRSGAATISADEHRAEHDVAGRLGLGEHHVLPDERREVERRDEHGDAQPAVERASATSTSAISAMYETGATRRRGSRDDTQSRRPSRRASRRRSPCRRRHESSIALRDRVHDEAEHDRAAEDDRELDARTGRSRASPSSDDDVEERSARRPARAAARAGR